VLNFTLTFQGGYYYEETNFKPAAVLVPDSSDASHRGFGGSGPLRHTAGCGKQLMKAYDIAPDTNPADNFSDAGSTYYTGYLAAAKRLEISAGVGNNLYAPGKEITRQEMFTLLYNALKVIGQLPQGDSGKTLSDFSDSNSVADWAEEAMTMLVKTGTIGGNAGKMSPTSTATRAEMAQVLYQLYIK